MTAVSGWATRRTRSTAAKVASSAGSDAAGSSRPVVVLAMPTSASRTSSEVLRRSRSVHGARM